VSATTVIALLVHALALFLTPPTTTLLARMMVNVNLTTATTVLARLLLEVQHVLSVKIVRVVSVIEVLAELLLLEVFKSETHAPRMLNVLPTLARLLVA
jgi:hypothetical protein